MESCASLLYIIGKQAGGGYVAMAMAMALALALAMAIAMACDR